MKDVWQTWTAAMGSLMVGFFIINFWVKWLRRRANVPGWLMRVPQTTVALLIVSAAVPAYIYWQLGQQWANAPDIREIDAAADQLLFAERATLGGFAVIGLAMLVLFVLSARSRKQERTSRR